MSNKYLSTVSCFVKHFSHQPPVVCLSSIRDIGFQLIFMHTSKLSGKNRVQDVEDTEFVEGGNWNLVLMMLLLYSLGFFHITHSDNSSYLKQRSLLYTICISCQFCNQNFIEYITFPKNEPSSLRMT